MIYKITANILFALMIFQSLHASYKQEDWFEEEVSIVYIAAVPITSRTIEDDFPRYVLRRYKLVSGDGKYESYRIERLGMWTTIVQSAGVQWKLFNSLGNQVISAEFDKSSKSELYNNLIRKSIRPKGYLPQQVREAKLITIRELEDREVVLGRSCRIREYQSEYEDIGRKSSVITREYFYEESHREICLLSQTFVDNVLICTRFLLRWGQPTPLDRELFKIPKKTQSIKLEFRYLFHDLLHDFELTQRLPKELSDLLKVE